MLTLSVAVVTEAMSPGGGAHGSGAAARPGALGVRRRSPRDPADRPAQGPRRRPRGLEAVARQDRRGPRGRPGGVARGGDAGGVAAVAAAGDGGDGGGQLGSRRHFLAERELPECAERQSPKLKPLVTTRYEVRTNSPKLQF